MDLENTTDLLLGNWLFNCPEKSTIILDIKESGKMSPGFEASIGIQMPPLKTAKASEFLEINIARYADDASKAHVNRVTSFTQPAKADAAQEARADTMKSADVIDTSIKALILGKYQRLPKCGAAKGVLYKHVRNDQYLLLDPAPYGDSKYDHLVFAATHERLSLGASRIAHARLPAGWLPAKLSQNSQVSCRILRRWFQLDGMQAAPSKKCKVAETWESSRASSHDLVQEPSMQPILTSHCKIYSPILVCKLPHVENAGHHRRTGQAYPINLVNQAVALKEFQWLLKPSSKIDMLNTWTDCQWIHTEGSNCICHPTPPVVQWRLAKKPGGQGVIVQPFEQQEQAVMRETKLKQIPLPVRAFLHCQPDSDVLAVELSIATLCHRALAGLKHVQGDQTSLRWRIASDDGLAEIPRFPTLELAGYDEIHEENHLDPDQRLTVQEQGSNLFVGGNTMYRRQQWTLDWMTSVESRTGDWQEWDRQEVLLPALDWRIDVEGFKTVDVRGGVLADEVGGGKTITSLALIKSTTKAKEPRVTITERTLRLRATLILVPKNLIGQWSGEITKFIGNILKCIVIKDWRDFAKISIHKFMQADIILAPWQIFTQQQYWEAMRKLVLAYNVPKVSGRAFVQWLDEATADLSAMVDHATRNCDEDDLSDLEKHMLKYRKSCETAAAKKYGDMFKAFRQEQMKQSGKGIVGEVAGAKEAIENLKKDTFQFNHARKIEDLANTLDDDYKDLTKEPEKVTPIFHLFNFKRLIVDEFSYLEKQMIPAIIRLNAEHRWMLSGTPTITNFTSLNYIAKLLGTSISPRKDNDIISSFIKANHLIENDNTSAEEFMSELEIESPALITARNERAKLFMATFVKQNKRLKPKKKLIETIIVSKMPVLETYIYDKVYQVVSAPIRGADRIAGEKVAETPQMRRDKPFTDAFAESKSPESALLTATSLLLARYRSLGQESASSDLDVLQGLKKEREGDFAAKCSSIVDWLARALVAWDSQSKSTSTAAPVANTHLAVFLENILEHGLGDAAVSGVLLRLARHASANRETLAGANTGSTTTQQNLGVKLNSLTTEVVQIVRELRLLTTVVELGFGSGGSMVCTQCGVSTAACEGFVLALCGHIACRECLESGKEDSNQCPSKGCNAPALGASIPEARYLPAPFETAVDETDPLINKDGSKMAAVMAQLRSIREKDGGDYILLFVQHQAHTDDLKRLLEEENLEFIDGTKAGTKTLPVAITKFGTDSKRILMLAIHSVDAAGWNLQAANHVLFVSPYLTKFAYNYKATMAQAQGRCFRHGQKKDVYVYHFLTGGTMEVEIFAQRQGQRLCRAVTEVLVERNEYEEKRWVLGGGGGSKIVKMVLKDMRGPQLSELEEEEGDDGEGYVFKD